MYRYSDLQKLKKRLNENVNSKSFTKKRLLNYPVECGFCSKESFVYITLIIFARRKQLCPCAHKIMKRVYWLLYIYCISLTLAETADFGHRLIALK